MKSSILREIIMTVIAIILFGILGYLHQWDYGILLETDKLIVAFLISGILGSLGYGWKPRIEKIFEKDESKDKTKNIYNQLYIELKDSLDSLDGILERETYEYTINEKHVAYKHIFMNHKVFDGLVNSGDFNKIDSKLHQPLQDIYGKIEIHDDYVGKIIESPSDDFALVLNKYENELLDEIPPLIEKLKKLASL